MDLGERVQNALSHTMRWSARRAWLVVGVVALITAGSIAVLLTVDPNVETDIQSGYFATYDEQANFFRELRANVAGVNSEIVYFELKENAQAPDADDPRCNGQDQLGLGGACPMIAVDDITSMESLRAQEELFTYVKAEFAERAGVDKVISHTSLPFFEKLIYKQFPGGCFCLAPDEAQHNTAQELLAAADSTGAISLYYDDNKTAAVMFIIYDPDTSVLSKKETGGLINEIIADYRAMPATADGPKTVDIWKEEYFDSWGVQSWIYRIDEQVEDESRIFIAAVFGFLTLTLLLLFRNAKRAAIGVSTVAIILLWTLAGMTLGGVSIGFVSMAMFPLLLGVGVDYVIHIVNEFGTERSHVASSEEAFDLIGRRGAVALFISTLTTITGFVVMITSTSPMIVEIGTATILGILSVFTLSITLLPALLELSVRNESREVFRPSIIVGKIARTVGHNKAPVIVVLLIGTIAFGAFIPKTEYVIGTVEVNLPQKELWTHKEDRAHMLDMYERFQVVIKAPGQETIITKAKEPGGLATKAAVDDMIAIHKAMVADPFVQASGGAVNSVPFILNLYALLKDGLQSATPGLLNGIVQGGQFLPCGDFPEGAPCGLDPEYDNDFGLIADWTDADVKAAYDDMISREEWKPLFLTFMDESYSIAWALTFVNIPIDQEATEKADAASAGVLEAADPQATDNHYFGTLSGIKKYNDYTNFWLTLSSIVSLIIVSILVGLFTKSIRAVAATITPMILTFIWWLGALPMPAVDIDLAFIFMIPIAFITSLGSDYAVHLTWNLEKQSSPTFVFRTVGKAVVYSAFTTAVAFFIFTRGAIRGSYEMFQAAVIAIIIMAFLTLACIPLYYYKRGQADTGEPDDHDHQEAAAHVAADEV
ncbi:MAG: MMPL family transporter [Thermoplasmatota archaeon]